MRRKQLASWQRTLYAVLVVQFASAVGFSLVFPLLPLYVQDLGSRLGWRIEFLAGLVFSAQAFTMMLASPVWGALADQLGRKVMVLRATASGALVLTLMGFARSAEELVLLRALQGLVTGTISANNALVAAVTPRDQVGYALGVLQVGLWAGVAVGPLLGGYVADTWGYRTAFVLTGGVLFLASLLVAFGVEERRAPAQTRQHSHTTSPVLAMWGEWRHLLTTPGVLLVYALRFLVRLGQAMTVPLMPLLVQALSTSTVGAATATGGVVGVRSALGAVSATWLGRLGDRVGYRRVVRVGLLVLALALLAHGLVSSVWVLLLLQALIGFMLGGITPVMSALLARYVTPGQEGAAYGLDNSVVAAARTVAPMIGATIAAWYGLRAAFVLGGLLYLVGGLLLVSRLPASLSTKEA